MFQNFKYTPGFRAIAVTVIVAFLGLIPLQSGYAQVVLQMPAAGQMIHVTPEFEPAQIAGLRVDLKDPFHFYFVMNKGERAMADEIKRAEYDKLVKYFLTALTIPHSDMWVNLSPYESTRIIPDNFAQTEMGRDLLAQDYILKQLASSMMYPEDDIGKKFWEKVYAQAQEKYGTTDIPIDTFNKVWIVADEADIFQKGDTAFLVNSHLKVMLEQDFMAATENKEQFGNIPQDEDTSSETRKLASDIVRDIIVPVIEKEVNQGESFAQVRQAYSALIMAAWFKRTLKESLLNQVYTDQNKVEGIEVNDPQAKQKIYQQYLEAYKVGVFNFIKEDVDPATQELLPRKYFSGGLVGEVPASNPERARAKAPVLARTLAENGSDTANVYMAAPNHQSAMAQGKLRTLFLVGAAALGFVMGADAKTNAANVAASDRPAQVQAYGVEGLNKIPASRGQNALPGEIQQEMESALNDFQDARRGNPGSFENVKPDKDGMRVTGPYKQTTNNAWAVDVPGGVFEVYPNGTANFKVLGNNLSDGAPTAKLGPDGRWTVSAGKVGSYVVGGVSYKVAQVAQGVRAVQAGTNQLENLSVQFSAAEKESQGLLKQIEKARGDQAKAEQNLNKAEEALKALGGNRNVSTSRRTAAQNAVKTAKERADTAKETVLKLQTRFTQVTITMQELMQKGRQAMAETQKKIAEVNAANQAAVQAAAADKTLTAEQQQQQNAATQQAVAKAKEKMAAAKEKAAQILAGMPVAPAATSTNTAKASVGTTAQTPAASTNAPAVMAPKVPASSTNATTSAATTNAAPQAAATAAAKATATSLVPAHYADRVWSAITQMSWPQTIFSGAILALFGWLIYKGMRDGKKDAAEDNNGDKKDDVADEALTPERQKELDGIVARMTPKKEGEAPEIQDLDGLFKALKQDPKTPEGRTYVQDVLSDLEGSWLDAWKAARLKEAGTDQKKIDAVNATADSLLDVFGAYSEDLDAMTEEANGPAKGKADEAADTADQTQTMTAAEMDIADGILQKLVNGMRGLAENDDKAPLELKDVFEALGKKQGDEAEVQAFLEKLYAKLKSDSDAAPEEDKKNYGDQLSYIKGLYYQLIHKYNAPLTPRRIEAMNKVLDLVQEKITGGSPLTVADVLGKLGRAEDQQGIEYVKTLLKDVIIFSQVQKQGESVADDERTAYEAQIGKMQEALREEPVVNEAAAPKEEQEEPVQTDAEAGNAAKERNESAKVTEATEKVSRAADVLFNTAIAEQGALDQMSAPLADAGAVGATGDGTAAKALSPQQQAAIAAQQENIVKFKGYLGLTAADDRLSPQERAKKMLAGYLKLVTDVQSRQTEMELLDRKILDLVGKLAQLRYAGESMVSAQEEFNVLLQQKETLRQQMDLLRNKIYFVNTRLAAHQQDLRQGAYLNAKVQGLLAQQTEKDRALADEAHQITAALGQSGISLEIKQKLMIRQAEVERRRIAVRDTIRQIRRILGDDSGNVVAKYQALREAVRRRTIEAQNLQDKIGELEKKIAETQARQNEQAKALEEAARDGRALPQVADYDGMLTDLGNQRSDMKKNFAEGFGETLEERDLSFLRGLLDEVSVVSSILDTDAQSLVEAQQEAEAAPKAPAGPVAAAPKGTQEAADRASQEDSLEYLGNDADVVIISNPKSTRKFTVGELKKAGPALRNMNERVFAVLMSGEGDGLNAEILTQLKASWPQVQQALEFIGTLSKAEFRDLVISFSDRTKARMDQAPAGAPARTVMARDHQGAASLASGALAAERRLTSEEPGPVEDQGTGSASAEQKGAPSGEAQQQDPETPDSGTGAADKDFPQTATFDPANPEDLRRVGAAAGRWLSEKDLATFKGGPVKQSAVDALLVNATQSKQEAVRYFAGLVNRAAALEAVIARERDAANRQAFSDIANNLWDLVDRRQEYIAALERRLAVLKGTAAPAAAPEAPVQEGLPGTTQDDLFSEASLSNIDFVLRRLGVYSVQDVLRDEAAGQKIVEGIEQDLEAMQKQLEEVERRIQADGERMRLEAEQRAAKKEAPITYVSAARANLEAQRGSIGRMLSNLRGDAQRIAGALKDVRGRTISDIRKVLKFRARGLRMEMQRNPVSRKGLEPTLRLVLKQVRDINAGEKINLQSTKDGMTAIASLGDSAKDLMAEAVEELASPVADRRKPFKDQVKARAGSASGASVEYVFGLEPQVIARDLAEVIGDLTDEKITATPEEQAKLDAQIEQLTQVLRQLFMRNRIPVWVAQQAAKMRNEIASELDRFTKRKAVLDAQATPQTDEARKTLDAAKADVEMEIFNRQGQLAGLEAVSKTQWKSGADFDAWMAKDMKAPRAPQAIYDADPSGFWGMGYDAAVKELKRQVRREQRAFMPPVKEAEIAAFAKARADELKKQVDLLLLSDADVDALDKAIENVSPDTIRRVQDQTRTITDAEREGFQKELKSRRGMDLYLGLTPQQRLTVARWMAARLEAEAADLREKIAREEDQVGQRLYIVEERAKQMANKLPLLQAGIAASRRSVELKLPDVPVAAPPVQAVAARPAVTLGESVAGRPASAPSLPGWQSDLSVVAKWLGQKMSDGLAAFRKRAAPVPEEPQAAAKGDAPASVTLVEPQSRVQGHFTMEHLPMMRSGLLGLNGDVMTAHLASHNGDVNMADLLKEMDASVTARGIKGINKQSRGFIRNRVKSKELLVEAIQAGLSMTGRVFLKEASTEDLQGALNALTVLAGKAAAPAQARSDRPMSFASKTPIKIRGVDSPAVEVKFNSETRGTFRVGDNMRSATFSGKDYPGAIASVINSLKDAASSYPAMAGAIGEVLQSLEKAMALGGINLSDENLTINIKVGDDGMPLPAKFQDPAMLNIRGLSPVIREIVPSNAVTIPLLSELMQMAGSEAA